MKLGEGHFHIVNACTPYFQRSCWPETAGNEKVSDKGASTGIRPLWRREGTG